MASDDAKRRQADFELALFFSRRERNAVIGQPVVRVGSDKALMGGNQGVAARGEAGELEGAGGVGDRASLSGRGGAFVSWIEIEDRNFGFAHGLAGDRVEYFARQHALFGGR